MQMTGYKKIFSVPNASDLVLMLNILRIMLKLSKLLMFEFEALHHYLCRIDFLKQLF